MLPIALTDSLYPGRPRRASFFQEGKFLTIKQVIKAMEKCKLARTAEMVQTFHETQQSLPSLLSLYSALPPKRFPLARLRHVTVKDCFKSILKEEQLDGFKRAFILNQELRKVRVSCWEVHLPAKDIAAHRQKRLADFRQLATERAGMRTRLSEDGLAEVAGMLANSPAMREDSRYGNFQISFSTRDLLALYQDQHCGGAKPALRVLGTEACQQEVVHWILVHNPSCQDFDHLPTVDPVGPFSRDGNLMWAPESTTDLFFYRFSKGALKKKPLSYSGVQTYNAWIWNNVVFAFHLPGRSALQISKSRLLANVQACHTIRSMGSASSRLLRHPQHMYVSKKAAQALIEQA